MKSPTRRPFRRIKITGCFAIFAVLLYGCGSVNHILNYPRKGIYQQGKPFLYDNRISLKGDFPKDESQSILQRLYGQLDDSSRLIKKDKFFIFHPIDAPPVYDSASTRKSALNMQHYLLHLGYYRAKTTYSTDTLRWGKQQRIRVTYTVSAGPATKIDSFTYRLNNADLQQLALRSQNASFLKTGEPVTKTNVLSEISRLADSFRNNGYYKFTTDDLKMLGDTSIEALTQIADNPFEALFSLEKANQQRNKPTIRLTLVQNPAADSFRLRKFYINRVQILPDFGRSGSNGQLVHTDTSERIEISYQQKLFENDLLLRNLYFRPGDLFSQQRYAQTISSFMKTGAWQSVTIVAKDSADQLNMQVQLVPARKFGFDANLEASYSTNSNNNASVANAGNLLGLSGNLSLQNRNLGAKGIKMTHAIRAGVELNLNAQSGTGERINSNEISYTNTISIPKLIFPFPSETGRKLAGERSFTNLNVANTNRINLFKLFSLGLSYGYELNIHRNRILTIKPINVEYSNLYGQSAAFDSTIEKNPYLRYSFNTALVMGSSIGISQTVTNRKHPNRQYSIRGNFEESGNLLFLLPLNSFGSIQKDLRQFVKWDVEFVNTINWKKSSFAWRAFAGFGVPIGKKDSSLPFFKQYFAGGPNSMRGWPIRGIGPGSKSLATFNERLLSDRTGDIRLELNAEYRYNIWQIRPNSIYLRGSLFVDAGNIWNMRNTQPAGVYDSLVFRLNPSALYKQLGVSAGTGFHLDFTYFLIRFDLGFRFKRPDIALHDGWQFPGISFKKLFSKGEDIPDPNNPGTYINDERYRKWRHENFNFTIGLSYPF